MYLSKAASSQELNSKQGTDLAPLPMSKIVGRYFDRVMSVLATIDEEFLQLELESASFDVSIRINIDTLEGRLGTPLSTSSAEAHERRHLRNEKRYATERIRLKIHAVTLLRR